MTLMSSKWRPVSINPIGRPSSTPHGRLMLTVLGGLAAVASLAIRAGLRAGVRGGGEGEETQGDEAGETDERAHRAVMVKQAPGGAPVSFS